MRSVESDSLDRGAVATGTITGSNVPATGVLTLSGTDTVAGDQAGLRAVTHEDSRRRTRTDQRDLRHLGAVLTLTGTSSVADYQTALRVDHVRARRKHPDTSKTIEFAVDDDAASWVADDSCCTDCEGRPPPTC